MGKFSFFFFLSAAALAAGPLYTVQSLGLLGPGAGLATGINNSGAAVGWVMDAQGNPTPLGFQGGQATALGSNAQANAINGAGVAVGTSYVGNTPSVMEWSNGTANSLGIAGYGTAINNAGQVGGGLIGADGQLHAFTWSHGVVTDLGTLGGSSSSVYGMNAQGQTAGTSMTVSGTFHAFFSNGNGLQDLGTLGGANSYGMAVNNAGQVVGNAQDAGGYSKAFEWDGTHLLNLGTLGGTQSYGYAINSAGDIVGYSWTSDGVAHAFVYSHGVMLDLNALVPIGTGWTIEGAYGINDAGDILAAGTYDGRRYAIELDPLNLTNNLPGLATPEPAAFLLSGLGLLLGLLLLVVARRKRSA